MAIYSAVPPPEQQAASAAHHQHTPSAASSVTVDIEAWTLSALEALSVSPVARGTGTPLSIPIDGATAVGTARRAAVIADPDHPAAGMTPPGRPPSRRDSQKRREAVLKGKEGSRARRRWENDRLMHVPNVQPPLPIDWEVHPTHPVHVVPYAVAQYWDRGLRQRVEEQRSAAAAHRRQRAVAAATGAPHAAVAGQAVGHVPRELRDTAKRTPAVKGWVRVLEEPVRRFLAEDAEEQRRDAQDDEGYSDEEIVFVGRRAAAKEAWKPARREAKGGEIDRGVVFDELGDDESAAFKRWLTHSISGYYGLASRSATVGKPPKKVVYVGIKAAGAGCGSSLGANLPRPMWELF